MKKIYRLEYKGEVVYVGQTIQKLNLRKNIGYKYIPFWKECDIVLIEETDDVTREQFWMDYYRGKGCKLYNKISGYTGLTAKEYSDKHNKIYCENNKEDIKERNRDDYWKRKYKKLNIRYV